MVAHDVAGEEGEGGAEVSDAIYTGPEGLPRLTLGWGLLAWASYYLQQPDGPDAGKSFVFTKEQVRFILWWYAIDDLGRFVYRSGVLRRMKGWGKDPIAAALSLIELCAPTMFSDWDANGHPVCTPHPAPWVQIAAVSRDQTRNTFTLFPTMISPHLKADFGLEVNKEIIHKRGGGRIEAVTSSPKALEGGRPHLVIMNETQNWLENNGGHEMEGVIAGNAAKGRGGSARRLAICNAHVPGTDSVAEHDYDMLQAILAGTTKARGFLYDCVEAPADTDLYDEESLTRGLMLARGDSDWLDIPRLIEEIYDPRTPVTESRRKYLNQVVAAEDAWCTPQSWDALMDSTLRLMPGDQIAMGFDGSKGNDHSALVACRISDGALFIIKTWVPSVYNGTIPSDDVNATVEWAFGTYNIVSFKADVKEFEAYIDLWGAKYGKSLSVKASGRHPVAFDMRGEEKRFTDYCERTLDAIIEGQLTHTGDALLRQYVLNCRRRPNKYGISVSKETKDSPRKIDAAVCAILAFAGRQEYLLGKPQRSREVTIL